jgi:hypothetical protein
MEYSNPNHNDRNESQSQPLLNDENPLAKPLTNPLINEGERIFANDYLQGQGDENPGENRNSESNKGDLINLDQNNNQDQNRHISSTQAVFSGPQLNAIQKLNIFVYNNYLLLIIIIFAGIFVMVPAVLLSRRDFTKTPRIRIQADDMIKPFVDKRNYRYLKLSNFMNVLLVSDPEMVGAGAALQTNIGSTFEPKEIPGLAHFLEHMLFMGSHKYPQENAFKDFLSQHGGNCNAFTNDESTTFYFALGADGLDRALEIFSRFFIDPLFKTDMVEREVSAINGEYENDLQSE